MQPVGGLVVGRDGWNSLMQNQPKRGGPTARFSPQAGGVQGQQQMMARPQQGDEQQTIAQNRNDNVEHRPPQSMARQQQYEGYRTQQLLMLQQQQQGINTNGVYHRDSNAFFHVAETASPTKVQGETEIEYKEDEGEGKEGVEREPKSVGES